MGSAHLRVVRAVGVVTGVEAQLEELYRKHRPGLVGLAFLLTGSADVAEEVVQDAFLRLQPRLDQVREPLAYIRQIVANGARQHHRRAAVERRHAPRPPGPALAPEIDETWEALWQLPERQRAALVLRFYEDLTVREVAAALGCRLGTAKSLIHRGTQALKELLRDDA